MDTRLVAAGITVAGAVLAMLIGPDGPLGGFWRPADVDTEPSAAVLAGLVGAGLVEAVGFGLALAILAVGRPLFARITITPGRATAAWLAAAWLLGSWWPHTALHRHIGDDTNTLVVIELVFHVGSIVVAGVLLWAILPKLMSKQAAAS